MLKSATLPPKKSTGTFAERIKFLSRVAKADGALSLRKVVGGKVANSLIRYRRGVKPEPEAIKWISETTGARLEWLEFGIEPVFETPPPDAHQLPKSAWELVPSFDADGKEIESHYCAKKEALRTQIYDLTLSSHLVSYLVQDEIVGAKYPVNSTVFVDAIFNTRKHLGNADFLLRDRGNGLIMARQIAVGPGDLYQIMYSNADSTVEPIPFSGADFDGHFEILGKIKYVGILPSNFSPPRLDSNRERPRSRRPDLNPN